MNEATPTNPADGGSYVRDPETGALSLREPTTAPPPGKSSARKEDPEPIPASIAGLTRRAPKGRTEPTNTTPEE